MIFCNIRPGAGFVHVRRILLEDEIALHVANTYCHKTSSTTSNGNLSVQYFEINYFKITSSLPSTTKIVAFKGRTSTD